MTQPRQSEPDRIERPSVGKRVIIRTAQGAKWEGVLVGYVDEPSIVMEDDSGHRFTVARSAIADLRERRWQ